jgi:hypothetical protein
MKHVLVPVLRVPRSVEFRYREGLVKIRFTVWLHFDASVYETRCPINTTPVPL